ncbi:hypothetical protein CD351_10460 [Erythrobacter sp. KY5]|uniref:hypothetical protein n=1 Tax=Erythrobacter sp. KY5 TaxID=2011159 RepID=UPI000DBF2A67|nr:hypothetical protein [Erythrobacter sp. KY5]AWW74845.1 hypothetical protein CD351_10460 [Erythrobacter sp. KY5]
MGEMAMDRTETTYVEAILKDELEREDRALRSVAPVISHMLDTGGGSLVSDAVVARLRGMLGDIARQLLEAGAPATASDVAIDQLVEDISDDSALIDHLYALALEGHLADRLEERFGIDPVLSPLVQELIASDHPATAELAMSAMAAQSRFSLGQRRMELPIGELPADLFSAVLERFCEAAQDREPAPLDRAIEQLRANYDEAGTRIGLLARLTAGMRGGAIAGLNLEHAGLALFTSSLAALTSQSRDRAIFSCHDRQSARLAISLRAAGLDAEDIEAQFGLLDQSQSPPDGLGSMPPEVALDMLNASNGGLA